MAAVRDQLGRVAWKRGSNGQRASACAHETPACHKTVPDCKKKVYESHASKISFHKLPGDKDVFRKRIIAIRRDGSKNLSDWLQESLLETIQSNGLFTNWS